MPIYEYNCDKCGVFEVTQRITETPLRRCPKCKRKVERILSRSSFILKGSGWYATDYGRKGTGTSTATSSDTNGSANGGSSSESSSTSSTSAASSKGSDKPSGKSID